MSKWVDKNELGSLSGLFLGLLISYAFYRVVRDTQKYKRTAVEIKNVKYGFSKNIL